MKKSQPGSYKKKSRVFAIKIDAEMAAFLEKLPNTSDYIRRAILSQLELECPLCRGSGEVPLGVGEHFQEVIRNAPPPPHFER